MAWSGFGAMRRTPPRRSRADASPPIFATRHRGLAEELRRLGRSLDSDVTILLLGDPGTGKDRLARLLHERSGRASEPFVKIDMGALADDLLESELFGHEKGAFTGAVVGKPGLLEGAGGGTIYLDRIDALSLRGQGKLLRLLEERNLRRVGGTRSTLIRARFVASGPPDLPQRARSGLFREDLLYRLAVITVRLPSLTDRRADIVPASRAILRSVGGPGRLAPAAEAALRSHTWRGNWRELENVLLRAAPEARSRGAAAIDVSDLALVAPSDPEELIRVALRAGWTLRALTDAYITLVLDECGGNVAEAARRLGVARKTLYERLRGEGI
jgi:DNA-binding NtrC family response regulator